MHISFLAIRVSIESFSLKVNLAYHNSPKKNLLMVRVDEQIGQMLLSDHVSKISQETNQQFQRKPFKRYDVAHYQAISWKRFESCSSTCSSYRTKKKQYNSYKQGKMYLPNNGLNPAYVSLNGRTILHFVKLASKSRKNIVRTGESLVLKISNFFYLLETLEQSKLTRFLWEERNSLI